MPCPARPSPNITSKLDISNRIPNHYHLRSINNRISQPSITHLRHQHVRKTPNIRLPRRTGRLITHNQILEHIPIKAIVLQRRMDGLHALVVNDSDGDLTLSQARQDLVGVGEGPDERLAVLMGVQPAILGDPAVLVEVLVFEMLRRTDGVVVDSTFRTGGQEFFLVQETYRSATTVYATSRPDTNAQSQYCCRSAIMVATSPYKEAMRTFIKHSW
ncbi:hypothetical protein CGCF415_v012377 [Colletotrichum fructicola]|nr:hypothetical protein CGCF415_v012377 [Colletotrichum fructicola]